MIAVGRVGSWDRWWSNWAARPDVSSTIAWADGRRVPRRTDPSRELTDEEVSGRRPRRIPARSGLPGRRPTSSSCRADAGRRGRTSLTSPLIGSSTSVGRHMKRGAVVVYESTGVPGRHRGGLHPGAGTRIRPEMETGLLRRLSARAHQPGGQGAHADQDPQDRLRRHAADAGQRRAAVREDRSCPACTVRRASRHGRGQPRSSRTRSATSTSR